LGVMNRFEPTSSRMDSRPGEANVGTHITPRCKQCSADRSTGERLTGPT
jgi:hypothetical protein